MHAAKAVAACANPTGRRKENIRVEVICDPVVADRIAARVRERFYDDYAMTAVGMQDVSVLRSDEF